MKKKKLFLIGLHYVIILAGILVYVSKIGTARFIDIFGLFITFVALDQILHKVFGID